MYFANFSKGIFEPFARAYYFGTDRLIDEYLNQAPDDACSFQTAKELCEMPWQGINCGEFPA